MILQKSIVSIFNQLSSFCRSIKNEVLNIEKNYLTV